MISSPNESQATSLVVLVVEDEPMLRKVVAATLRIEGFNVLEAGDGTEGLEILESDKRVDALLTDVRMPGLNGYQLAEASLALRPSLPVMLMTGYTEEEMPAAIREAPIAIIRKPFDFTTLGGSLRDLVARR